LPDGAVAITFVAAMARHNKEGRFLFLASSSRFVLGASAAISRPVFTLLFVAGPRLPSLSVAAGSRQQALKKQQDKRDEFCPFSSLLFSSLLFSSLLFSSLLFCSHLSASVLLTEFFAFFLSSLLSFLFFFFPFLRARVCVWF
jgi:hypothetical protein